MAKTKDATTEIPAGQLGDWKDKYPDEVVKAAEEYDKAHAAEQKAKGKKNTAKDNVIAAMREHDCQRVPIRNGASGEGRSEGAIVLDMPSVLPARKGARNGGGRPRAGRIAAGARDKLVRLDQPSPDSSR